MEGESEQTTLYDILKELIKMLLKKNSSYILNVWNKSKEENLFCSQVQNWNPAT